MIAPASSGEEIVVKGRVTKVGKNMIFAGAKAYAGDKLLAESRGTFYRTNNIEIKE